MSDELVTRLRDYDRCHDGDIDEAADTIERLTKYLDEAECELSDEEAAHAETLAENARLASEAEANRRDAERFRECERLMWPARVNGDGDLEWHIGDHAISGKSVAAAIDASIKNRETADA